MEQQPDVGLPSIWQCMVFVYIYIYIYTYTVYSQSHHLRFRHEESPTMMLLLSMFHTFSHRQILMYFLVPASQRYHCLLWVRWLEQCAVVSLESSGCCQKELLSCTPLKIDMEPKNHPFAKENHLPNLHYCVPRSFSRV